MNDTLKIQFGNIVLSYLGPYTSNKFVIDDEEVYLIKCPLQLLQKIKLKGGMTYIIEDALNLHHDQYNCSTTSFLAMWYFWYEEFQTALDEGCLLSHIIEHAQNILEEVISYLPEISIQCSSILDQEQDVSKNTLSLFSQNSDSNKVKHFQQKSSVSMNTKLSTNVPVGIRYSSRHYSPFSSHLPETEENKQFIHMNYSLKQTMSNIAFKLCHGKSDFTKMISDIWIKQVTFTKCRKFNIKGINICPIILPSTYSTVVDGLIIKSTLTSVHSQELMRCRNYRALIIKSASFEYIPLGCNVKVNINNKVTAEELKVSEKALWVKQCCDLLSKLQVNFLLVNGEVDCDIASFCSAESILVFHSIPWNTLVTLSEFLNEPPCTFLLNCDSGNILNLKVENWNFGDKILNKEEYLHIEVKDPTHDKQLLTVILCHPNYFALNCLEHQFWHEAFRLHFATVENKLLPGCGRTEEWCFKKLQRSTHKHNCRVTSAVAQGFERYFESVSNKMKEELQGKLDEMSSKIQAWRSAMALSLIPLQIDNVILTGLVDATEDLKHEVIGFL